MEDKKLRPLAILRDAFLALQVSHPELVVRLSAMMNNSSGSRESQLLTVESAFREAARALLSTDRVAAETLFTFAEVLAQTASDHSNRSRQAHDTGQVETEQTSAAQVAASYESPKFPSGLSALAWIQSDVYHRLKCGRLNPHGQKKRVPSGH